MYKDPDEEERKIHIERERRKRITKIDTKKYIDRVYVS
jgi:hypothetical protein